MASNFGDFKMESFADKYIAYKVHADPVKFKNTSSVLITFHPINSMKVIQRLINTHIKLVGQHIIDN